MLLLYRNANIFRYLRMSYQHISAVFLMSHTKLQHRIAIIDTFFNYYKADKMFFFSSVIVLLSYILYC